MHLFGKSAHWWLCFPLQQFKTENKIRAWKYSLCPSQKLKLFSECVKYPRIWPRSKTKAKQGCWERENHVLLETCSYSWLLLAQLMTGGFHLLRNWNFVNSLTRLQGACQALKSSPAVWWIRLKLLPLCNTSRHISPIYPRRFLHPLCNRNLFAFFCNFWYLWLIFSCLLSHQVKCKWE